jgi:hypothetical protein
VRQSAKAFLLRAFRIAGVRCPQTHRAYWQCGASASILAPGWGNGTCVKKCDLRMSRRGQISLSRP